MQPAHRTRRRAWRGEEEGRARLPRAVRRARRQRGSRAEARPRGHFEPAAVQVAGPSGEHVCRLVETQRPAVLDQLGVGRGLGGGGGLGSPGLDSPGLGQELLRVLELPRHIRPDRTWQALCDRRARRRRLLGEARGVELMQSSEQDDAAVPRTRDRVALARLEHLTGRHLSEEVDRQPRAKHSTAVHCRSSDDLWTEPHQGKRAPAPQAGRDEHTSPSHRAHDGRPPLLPPSLLLLPPPPLPPPPPSLPPPLLPPPALAAQLRPATAIVHATLRWWPPPPPCAPHPQTKQRPMQRPRLRRCGHLLARELRRKSEAQTEPAKVSTRRGRGRCAALEPPLTYGILRQMRCRAQHHPDNTLAAAAPRCGRTLQCEKCQALGSGAAECWPRSAGSHPEALNARGRRPGGSLLRTLNRPARHDLAWRAPFWQRCNRGNMKEGVLPW